MKKISIVMLSFMMALSVSAQRGHFHSTVIVGGGYSPYYNPYYSYGYYGLGYPYPRYYGRGYRPTKLDLKIEDIENDYKQRIWGAKHDESLTHKERRQEVRQLKHDRDQAITDAKRNYYKQY